jgi:hypothetical protein
VGFEHKGIPKPRHCQTLPWIEYDSVRIPRYEKFVSQIFVWHL